ncbi:MAG TPA: CHAT domain-containing tetratricopeptide repeat protein [Steroidobacteraceae bacterium]|nr:CHAT domain-containing tetratricopeptide repeat protein [Steroidobacteraceae bacterium]
MSARGSANDTNTSPRTRAIQVVSVIWALCLGACSGGFEADPLVEYSTDVVVTGVHPHHLSRQLDAGVYLVEVRERDVDLRVRLDAGDLHSELADAFLRHGLYRTVVRLPAPARLDVTLDSVDLRGWKGAAALRILRWPESDVPDQRLLGFEALGHGNELIARGTSEAWQAALEPLREAARHFQAANDLQSLAEAEYQRGFLESNLLFRYSDSRRSALSALAHFQSAGDSIGAQRTEMLLALDEFGLASGVSPEAPRAQQLALLNTAERRAKEAQIFFETRDLQSDALTALKLSCSGDAVLGRMEDSAPVFETIRRRAQARGDQYFEVAATQNLATLALNRGDAVRAAAMYESVLPLIERERNPELYATLLSQLGHALIALGEFDRAQMLHSEALTLFAERGDDSQKARELAALAAIQFRSGNVERALATIESALPLYESSNDHDGYVSALRLAGNAAAALDRHALAISYLRNARFRDPNGITIDRTLVLLAGELRIQGELREAETILSQVLDSTDESTRADALQERARLRQRQSRDAEALADLRAADAIYARLRLDFNRIDSSSALARALLESGDLEAAAKAAETAVALETRIRVKAANPEMRARFLSASHAPYEARIEVELAAGPRDPAAIWSAFRTAEAIRARSLTDRLAHGERGAPIQTDPEIENLREIVTALQVDLERRTRGGKVTESDLLEARRRIDATQAQLDARLLTSNVVGASNDFAIAESREAVQAALPEDTAVLAYFVGEAHSHVWLLTRKEMRHAAIPGRSELQALVAAFIGRQRSSIKSPESTTTTLLGGVLVGVNAKRLLVLPDGPLNGLPFAALPSPRTPGRELLLDRFIITSASSLALALHRPETNGEKATLVAVISDPVYTADDRRLTAAISMPSQYRGLDDNSNRLARLPYSAIEARAVRRAFAGTDIIELTGFDATARRVIELPSRELRVLHFATHAVVRRDAPEQSALFLSEYSPQGAPLSSDRLTADDITRSGLRADVVVLSGCATGDGRELRGEGVLGLTYGFLANGSQAVVASLWPVEDALTARFMEEFYGAYRTSGRADDALRIAQLRSRASVGASVWSSFVVRASSLP